MLRFYGASISDKVTKYTTHVIVDPADMSRLPLLTKGIGRLKQTNKDMPIANCKIVSRAWVTESAERRADLDESSFSFTGAEILRASQEPT